ncbi:amino acid adenylation domain-containing protein [Streptomyces cyaneofuscatus]|uniref:amino acid adenylation domain-containing protein n=1 Tax=Streptomyces cyaneofuscatus TaxID=66883 RepID=UPI003862F7C4|nr:amino acid adenylation domain-containing protein [Streptomyces cyaneofuscatus]
MTRTVPPPAPSTTEDWRAPLPVHLEHTAARHPDAPAVDTVSATVTYAVLLRRVHHLANRLTALGVGPEDRIGIALPHSPDLLIAALAVMRSGAAYVPVDPEYPAARRAFILADAGVKALITGDHAADAPGAHILAMDAGEADACLVEHRARSGDLACVIYTSGSTGRPKGVMITHEGLSNLADSAARSFAIGSEDRYLMVASPAFSASLEELFPPLLAGACACFPQDRAALAEPTELLRVLADRRITLAEIQTAQWHPLVRHLDTSDDRLPRSLRLLVMGGERPQPEVYARWQRRGVPLIHVYGPTETTATATYHDTSAERPQPDGRLPIGRAIPRTRCHVVDPLLRPVPPGEAGELCVGGVSLARGYLGRPAATAERFVPDPFSAEPGARLYRTGDLARLLPDGQLEFLDRLDQQVKIRGVRVEPGEVEAALRRHPAVGDAVVVTREVEPGHRQLVGHVTTDDPHVPLRLREFLSAELPSHSVPSAFVQLRELPLTAHRKVDRAALPEPGRQRPDLRTPYVPPRGGTEQELAALWARLLNLDEVGVDDDFLELGGDSLLVLRMTAKVAKRFGVRVSPRQAFAERTVRTFGALLGADAPGAAPAPVAAPERPAGPPAGGGPGLPAASPVQQGMWLLSRLMPQSPANNTAWQCGLSGDLDTGALRRAFAELVRRHEVLGCAYPEVGGTVVQGRAAGEPEYLETDLRTLPPEERESAAARHAREWALKPFDVARGPLLRTVLLRLADDRYLLVCSLHHLIFDLRSQQVMLQDLADVYQAMTRPGPVELPPAPPVGYSGITARAAALRPADAAEREDRAYWAGRFEDLPSLRLPGAAGLRPGAGYDGGVHAFRLPDGLASRAAELGRAEGASLFMVLLAAHTALLNRWTGEPDIGVVTPLAGRTLPEADDVMGLFTVNSLIRTYVEERTTFRRLLGRVRGEALSAFAHQDISLEYALERFAAGPRSQRPALPVLFSFQRDASSDVVWPGLRIGPITDLPTGTTKFPLSLILHERADGLVGRVEYLTSQLGPEQAAELADAYRELLGRVLSDPDQQLAPSTPA